MTRTPRTAPAPVVGVRKGWLTRTVESIIRHREALALTAAFLLSCLVAFATGRASWLHIVHIGELVGEPSAKWLPVAIDGMMLNGTVLAAVDRFRGRVTRPWAVVSLWLGSIATLAFNVASAQERGLWAMVVAASNAVALLVTVEAMFHPSQRFIEAKMGRKFRLFGRRKEVSVTPVQSAPVSSEVSATTTTPPAAKPPSQRRPSSGGGRRSPATDAPASADKPQAERSKQGQGRRGGWKKPTIEAGVPDTAIDAALDATPEVAPVAVSADTPVS